MHTAKLPIIINDRRRAVALSGRPLDEITKDRTAFLSFDALLNAQGGYRPSIYLGRLSAVVRAELLTLALAYNSRQAARGDDRRVYQGDWQPAA